MDKEIQNHKEVLGDIKISVENDIYGSEQPHERDLNRIAALRFSIDLITRYQSITGMPKEKTTFYCSDACDSCGEVMNGEICPKDAHNACLAECKMAMLKMRPSEGELIKIIKENWLPFNKIKETGINMEAYEKDVSILATALLKKWNRRLR